MVNGEGKGVGAHLCLGSGSVGELGRLEPMVNLALGFGLSLDLCGEKGSGDCVLDNFVRCDKGCKNGGENGGSPPGFCNRSPDELRCRPMETRCGCDCQYWYGFL